MKKIIRALLFFCGIFLFSLYTFSQALTLVPDAASAEEILLARDILRGDAAPGDWQGEIIALPLYLAGVKVFGVGTYVHVFVFAALWLLFCGCEWLFLHRLKLDTVLGTLFWFAIAALPDNTRMSAFASRADFSLLLLAGLGLAAEVIRNDELRIKNHGVGADNSRKTVLAVATGVVSLLLLGAYWRHAPKMGNGRDCLFALRALQQVFRADFSAQPLLKFSTGRYFLMSLLLLLCLAAIIGVLLRWQHSCRVSRIYAGAFCLTMLFCALPFSGSLSEKVSLCSWVPYGTAVLLITEYRDLHVSALRITEARIPLEKVLLPVFLVLCLCGVNPILRSRPANAADRLADVLNKAGYTRGYCEQQFCARLEVAAKGGLQLSDDPEMEAPQFAVTEDSEFRDIQTFHLD